MITIKTIEEFGTALYFVEKLRKISKTLHRLDEGDCNGRSEQGEKISATREKNCMVEAQRLAGELGLEAYHQGDPRGCSLYLIEHGTEDHYSAGIAIF